MAGATRGRRRNGGRFTHVIRTPIMIFLAWASVAFMSVAIARVSAAPSLPRSTLVDSSRSAKPICWETTGLYERDCFHDEALTAKTYPLTPGMLERASSRYTTTDLSLHRAFEKARKRGELKVVVVGGSVTVGHHCVSPAGLDGIDCAWPHRLQQWFDERIDEFTVEVTNAAIPRCSILDLLHNYLQDTFPVDLEVDLIIVDFGVNDAVLEQFGMDTNNVKLAHEVFIRYVRNDMIRMPALLYAESFMSETRVRRAPLQARNMAEVHAAVTMKYDIPMVSFRDAVWPDQANPSLANHVWGSGVHPDWQVHQLLADVLVYFIEKSYARFLGEHGLLANPSRQERALSLFKERLGCMPDDPSFILDASTFVGLPPPDQQVESVGWSFSKDERGPGGLTGFGNSSTNAVVSFDLQCTGERRLLDIGYLRSYIGMGAVKVVVRGSDASSGGKADKHSNGEVVVILDGLWKTQASIVDTEVIPTPGGSDQIRVTFEVLSAKNEAPHVKTPPGVTAGKARNIRLDRKFKVAKLQCC